MKQLWKPVKRDTNLFLDLIAQLKASQKFKHELNVQISAQKKLISILKMPVIILYVGIIIAPVYCFQKIMERKISSSKAIQVLDTMEKQEKIYHKNVLTLENDLDGTLEVCNENFETALTMIKHLADHDPNCEDAHVLLAKYKAEPPTNKLDRLQLFLSMEACLIRFRN